MGINKKIKVFSFKTLNILEKYKIFISIFVIIFLVISIFYLPVISGFFLIIIISIFLIGTFDPAKLKKSLFLLFIFLFLIIVIFSPICFYLYSITEEFHLNNKIDPVYHHPEIIEMTNEFHNLTIYDKDDYQNIVNEIEEYVAIRISYAAQEEFLSTTEVLSKMEASCFGRALIGYTILKNLNYNVYIVYSATVNHTWLRIYDNDTYYESYSPPQKYTRPLIRFNEKELDIVESADTLYGLFINGIYKEELENYGFVNFDFSFPFFLLLFFTITFILIKENERKIINYIIFWVIAFVVCYSTVELNLLYNEFLFPVLWIIVSGIFLRIIYSIYHIKRLKELKKSLLSH
jgi:hypothetical protein